MGKKEKKLLEAQNAAMREAAERASHLYQQHERERTHLELLERVDRDAELFISGIENEALQKQAVAYSAVESRLDAICKLAFSEHERQCARLSISSVTEISGIKTPADVNSFIASWESVGEENEFLRHEGRIDAELRLLKSDAEVKQKNVIEELHMCWLARRLNEQIFQKIDNAVVVGDRETAYALMSALRSLSVALLKSLDRITVAALHHAEVFFEQGTEMFLRWTPQEAGEVAPEGPKDIKFGLWARMRTGEMVRHLPHLKFAGIGLALEPREGQQRLPRALGLSKDTAALRAIQFSFDPLSVFCDEAVGHQFMALDCVLLVEPVEGCERARAVGDFTLRAETPSSTRLTVLPYKPREQEDGAEDAPLRVSFEVPCTVVVRHPGTPLIGSWDGEKRLWMPLPGRCSQLVNKFMIATTEVLSALAIVQETAFDMPYASWMLVPQDDDTVMIVIEGREDRGEQLQDREIRFLVRDDKCQLLTPERPELAPLREGWFLPRTFLRRLAKFGLNLLLSDADAKLAKLRPKSRMLEQKCYADIALFASKFAFSSTRHNKAEALLENPNVALLRISCSSRGNGALRCDPEAFSEWRAVRYETARCGIAAADESSETTDPSFKNPGDSYMNLFMLLNACDKSKDDLEGVLYASNKVVQRCVYQILMFTRPLSWG